MVFESLHLTFRKMRPFSLFMMCGGSDWENLTHVFMDEKNKAIIKEQLGLKAVPFYIIINRVRGHHDDDGFSAVQTTTTLLFDGLTTSSHYYYYHHHCSLAQDGTIAQMGGPKDVDFTKLPDLISGSTNTNTTNPLSFEEDF